MSLTAYQYQALNYTTLVTLPGASVSVYFTGTVVFAPLYDLSGNPISNPMTADTVTGIAIFQVQSTAIYDLIAQSGAYVSPRWLLSEIAAYAEFGAVLAGLQTEVAAIEAGVLSGSQAPNEVLASPNGASGPMSVRALVPADLPAGILSGLTVLGVWNASSNSPTLTSSVGVNGTYYIVGVAGSTTLDGNTGWLAGNYALFAGGVWNKVINTGAVSSVAGRVGAIVLAVADVAGALAGAAVSSLTALAALNTSVSTYAILTAVGLYGPFAWNSANLATQVTNDPGKGIYVATASDPTGASGAWVRQYSGKEDLDWWGPFVSDTTFANSAAISANSTALFNFSVWARYQSSLGYGVDVTAPEGSFPWDMAISLHWPGNIKLMHFTGYKSVWKNISTNPQYPIQWPIDWPGFMSTLNGLPSGGRYLINSTTVGSLAITAITPSDFANLVVGDYVLLTSLDLEYTGYPPNAGNFEYPAIVSIYQNASASPSSVTYSNANGALALTFASPPLGAVTLAATASFTAGVSKIQMSSVAGLVTGMNVFDTTNTQQIGTIASINGLVVGLVNNASHASSGSTDSLVFTPQINGALVTQSGMTATGGTPPNGTWPILSVSGDGKTVSLQTTTGLGTLTFTANGTLAASAIAVMDRPIRCQHMSTFPDNPANANPAGAARVNILKNNGGSGSTLWDWNVKHIWEGLTVLEASAVTNGQGYITMSGKHVEWRNATFPGISPTVVGLCKIVGCTFSLNPLGSQPDKLIDVCILEGNEIPQNMQFSASTNVLVATGNYIGGIFQPGAKFNICNGNNINQLTPASTLGVTRSVIINGGTVNKFPAADHFGSGVQFVVGSGGITYASGTFTFPWTNLGVPAVPGMMFHFAQASGLYAGDLGSMMVTGIRGDATNLYVDTTCQSAAVPAFSTGQVFVRHLQRLIVNGVSGCDEIRRVSAACERGFQELEYLEEQIIGSGTFAGHDKSIGAPVHFELYVRQPCAVASKTLTLTLSMNQTSSPTTTATLTWVIDLSTIGRRMVNRTSGAAILLGADSLSFSVGGATTFFAPGWFLNGNSALAWALSYAPGALTSVQLPWVEMEFQFDPGMYFTVPTAQLDQALLATLIGQQGALN